MNSSVSFSTSWRPARHVLAIILVALFILIQSYSTLAEGYLPLKDKQRLSSYINTYESGKLIADPTVKPQMEHFLGNELNHLKKNIEVHGAIGVISGILYISGNAPHKGGLEHGFLGIDLYSGIVYAVLLTDGKIKVYGKENEYSWLPDGVRHWILVKLAYTNLNGKAPPSLEMRAGQ